MENQKNNLVEKIENKIKQNKIKMKPRWHFIFKTAMIISFVCILLLVIIYIGNFILFIFHEQGQVVDVLSVGHSSARSILEFIKSIPVLLVLLISIFIFSLFKLVKDYAFVYRRNIFYLIFFFIIFVVTIVVNIHMFLDREFQMARFGEKGEIPFLQNVHKYYLGDRKKFQQKVFTGQNLGPQGVNPLR